MSKIHRGIFKFSTIPKLIPIESPGFWALSIWAGNGLGGDRQLFVGDTHYKGFLSIEDCIQTIAKWLHGEMMPPPQDAGDTYTNLSEGALFGIRLWRHQDIAKHPGMFDVDSYVAFYRGNIIRSVTDSPYDFRTPAIKEALIGLSYAITRPGGPRRIRLLPMEKYRYD